MLAACAVLWGYVTGQWVIGGLLGLALESQRVIRSRWDFSTEDFRKIASLCTVALLLLVVYFATTTSARDSMPKMIQWLPLVLLPLLLASQFSVTGKLDPAALFMLSKRRASKQNKQIKLVQLDFSYAALLVLAASGSNQGELIFYSAMALIAGWALWLIRPRRYSALLWLGIFTTVAAVGFLSHIALNSFQHWLVDATAELFIGSRTDPYRQTTDLGHIGALKLSDEILMRVELDQDLRTPLLLHRASYNFYADQTWVARRAPLRPIQGLVSRGFWSLAEGSDPPREVTIVTEMENGISVVALPTGAAELRNPSLIELKRNRLGTIRATGEPGLMRYTTKVFADVSLPGAPDDDDLVIPVAESELLNKIVRQLGLAKQSPAEAVATLEAYFDADYHYSLYQESSLLQSPLTRFLSSSHAGHCEYFATAATLLLRAAGIPARYATGFSVQEYSQLEGVYLVRLRHAHAWTRAYVDGRWIDTDTTPPAWLAIEEQGASVFEPLLDLWSWIWHQYLLWKMDSQGSGQQWILLLSLPVFGYLLFRIRGRRQRVVTADTDPSALPVKTWQGMDSDLFEIETRLVARGFGRQQGETSAVWAQRLADIDPQFASLEQLVKLHYQYRFDDRVMAPAIRLKYALLVNEWLTENRSAAGTAAPA